jgi:5-methylthioadenosine/S-adenosylhomocysteine deaminase
MEQLDYLLIGATVLTAEPDRPVIEDAVIGIAANRIALLASRNEMRELPAARERRDMTGRVITPGLVNIHTHAILTVVRGVADDMGFAPAYTKGVVHGHDIDPAEAVALARLGAAEALLAGSTLINDSYVHADVTMAPMAELGLRVQSCGRIHDVDFTRVHEGIWEHDESIGDATLDAALTLAERWHGAMNGRIGVPLAAHAPDTCSDRLLRRVAEESTRRDLRVSTHLAQSRIEIERIRQRSNRTSAELLDDCGLLNERLIAAHGIWLSDADIERVGRSGMTLAHVPIGNATGAAIAPTAKLRAAGTRIAIGTDNNNHDMLEAMRWAVAVGRIQAGSVSLDWQPEHALEMATRAGAAALGLGHEIGSLCVGKQADLVAVDCRRAHLTPFLRPLGLLVHYARGSDVEMVMVDGEVVVEDGRLVHAELDEVCREAERAAKALWARVQ